MYKCSEITFLIPSLQVRAFSSHFSFYGFSDPEYVRYYICISEMESFCSCGAKYLHRRRVTNVWPWTNKDRKSISRREK